MTRIRGEVWQKGAGESKIDTNKRRSVAEAPEAPDTPEAPEAPEAPMASTTTEVPVLPGNEG